tara:strand:+ start:300 stop:488 length:189 start_codon:yes stop_codon:yes gene_type:complete
MIQKLQAELADIVARQSKMHEKHMQRYRDGTATRAKTTTHNANVGRLQERAVWLRSEIKALS